MLETQRWVFFPVNFLDLGATRPECVFGSVYYTFQIGRVWSVIVLLLSVPVAQSLLKRRQRRARATGNVLCFGKAITQQTWDYFELAETIIFQIQFLHAPRHPRPHRLVGSMTTAHSPPRFGAAAAAAGSGPGRQVPQRACSRHGRTVGGLRGSRPIGSSYEWVT